jgi:hypothetical protein
MKYEVLDADFVQKISFSRSMFFLTIISIKKLCHSAHNNTFLESFHKLGFVCKMLPRSTIITYEMICKLHSDMPSAQILLAFFRN